MTEFDEVASFLIHRASHPELGIADQEQLESLLFAYLKDSDANSIEPGSAGQIDSYHGLRSEPTIR